MQSIALAVARHFASVQRDLPWRRTRDPYAIWVSEIMLQQTRVATVIPYWERWMQRFPSVTSLAAAPLDDVLAAWAGLGYYSRARNLHAGAKAIGARTFPSRASELRSVPGIGPYTAGAIASIAFGERAPLVDGNVSRVLARVFAIEHDIKSSAGQRAIWAKAGELMTALPESLAPGDLNLGLMELGATTCTPTSPRCLVCPLAKPCRARAAGRTSELPRVAKRKKPHELPLLAWTALWIERDRCVLLVRRAPDGLFGGLWELPPLELARALGVTSIGDVVAHHDQVLTHRRLQLTVATASMPARLGKLRDPGYDAMARVPLADLGRLGIAAATAAIVAKYEDDPWTSTRKRSASSKRATPRSSRGSASSATPSATRTSPTPRAAPRRASTSSSTTSRRSTARSKR